MHPKIKADIAQGLRDFAQQYSVTADNLLEILLEEQRPVREAERGFHSLLRGRLHAGGYPTRPLTDLATFWLRFGRTQPKGLLDEEVQRVRCPILMICGADDAIVSVSHGQRIAETAADGTLLVIPNAGHLDAHVVDPQRHDQALRAFVKRVQNSVN